jgi:hypothetical protein
MTNGVTVTSLSASLRQKISAATDHLYQIMLNQKLLHKFKKWDEFSSSVEANHAKKKSHKMRPACINNMSIYRSKNHIFTTCFMSRIMEKEIKSTILIVSEYKV